MRFIFKLSLVFNFHTHINFSLKGLFGFHLVLIYHFIMVLGKNLLKLPTSCGLLETVSETENSFYPKSALNFLKMSPSVSRQGICNSDVLGVLVY